MNVLLSHIILPVPSTSVAPIGRFPMTPEEFQSTYQTSFMSYGWEPAMVLDYMQDPMQVPGIAVNSVKCNIVSADRQRYRNQRSGMGA